MKKQIISLVLIMGSIPALAFTAENNSIEKIVSTIEKSHTIDQLLNGPVSKFVQIAFIKQKKNLN